MFDDLSLDELREWKREIYTFLRSNMAVQSFSMPDGISMNVTKDDAWKCLEEINLSIKRKLGRRGKFVRMEMR